MRLLVPGRSGIKYEAVRYVNRKTVQLEPDGNPENWVKMKFKNIEELIIVSNCEVNRYNLFD